MSAPAAWPGKTTTVVVAVGLALVIGLLGLMAYGLALRGRTSESLKGQKSPPLVLSLFDGGTASLEELRGQVVVVNFWASWCVECRDEAGLLEATWKEYRGRGVAFLGVVYTDTEPEARAYIEKYGLTYPNGPDLGGKISRAYRITGVPETFFVAKDGRLAFVKIGPLERTELLEQIDELLAE